MSVKQYHLNVTSRGFGWMEPKKYKCRNSEYYSQTTSSRVTNKVIVAYIRCFEWSQNVNTDENILMTRNMMKNTQTELCKCAHFPITDNIQYSTINVQHKTHFKWHKESTTRNIFTQYLCWKAQTYLLCVNRTDWIWCIFETQTQIKQPRLYHTLFWNHGIFHQYMMKVKLQ